MNRTIGTSFSFSYSNFLFKKVRKLCTTKEDLPISSFLSNDLEEITRRLKLKPRATIKNTNRAAVLIPLCFAQSKGTTNLSPSILFTLRSNSVRTHKGEVSFPGGKLDPTDSSAEECALRETEEEIGVQKSKVQILGRISDVLSKDSISVTPVIGFLGNLDISKLSPNPDEIDHCFTLSLTELTNPNMVSFEKLPRGILPVFKAGEHRVWGLTAYILHIFLKDIMKIMPRNLDMATK